MALDKINKTSVSEMWQQSSDAYITIKHNSHAAAFAKFTTASWCTTASKCKLFSHYLSTALVLKTAAKMLHSCVMETPPTAKPLPKSKYFILCLFLLLVKNGIEAYCFL